MTDLAKLNKSIAFEEALLSGIAQPQPEASQEADHEVIDLNAGTVQPVATAQPEQEPPTDQNEPENPDSAEPQFTFADRALLLAARNIPVIPLKPKTKVAFISGWENLATTSQEQIRKWNAQNADYNVASVAKAQVGGVWFFEVDRKIVVEEIKKQTGQKMPITFVVRSSPGKAHFYFRQNAASIAMGNKQAEDEQGELWSARVDDRYVVGPGSIHPKTGKPYEILRDTEIIEAPQWLIDFCIKNASAEKKTVTASINGPKIPRGSHDITLTSIAGKLREDGLEEEAIYNAIVEVCEKRCENYGDDYLQMCRKIAHSVCRYEPGQQSVAYVGSSLAKVMQPEPIDVSNWRSQFRSIGQMEQGDILMLIDGFLPEGTTIVGALPAHGKTLFALSIAKALTTGRPLFGNPEFAVTEKRPVLYLIPEQADKAFRTRCEAFRIPDSEMFLCRTISSGAPLALDNPLLLEAVRQTKCVVFLDTAIRFNKAGDENSAAANKQLVDDIIALRAAGAVGIVLLHHAKKDSEEGRMSLETMLRGTGDLGAMVDTAYGLRRDRLVFSNGGGPFEFFVENLKPRDMVNPPAPFKLAATYRKDGALLPVSHVNETGDFAIVNPAETAKRAVANLLSVVADNPDSTVEDLAALTGMKEYMVKRELRNHGWHTVRGGAGGSSPWHQDNGKSCPYEKPKRDIKTAQGAVDLNAPGTIN